MRILIIYRFPHHHVMMKRMASLLSKEGIKADVLCLKTLEFTNNSKLWWGKIGSFLFTGIPKYALISYVTHSLNYLGIIFCH